MIIKVHFDGACRNVKGLRNSDMGIGVAVFVDKEYRPDLSEAVFISAQEFGAGTSNVAEWLGCVRALITIERLKKTYPQARYIVYSDSQLITNQYNNKYRVNENFIDFYNTAQALGRQLRIPLIEWIPRELNKEADMLSKQGLKG